MLRSATFLVVCICSTTLFAQNVPTARPVQNKQAQTPQGAVAAPRVNQQPTWRYSNSPVHRNYYYAPAPRYYSGALPWPGFPTDQFDPAIARAYSPAAGLRPGQVFGTFGIHPAGARVMGFH